MIVGVKKLFALLPLRTWARFGCLAISLSLVVSKTSLVISASDSLNDRVYLLIKGAGHSRGDTVLIQGHPTSYVNGRKFAKRLVGSAGDGIGLRDGWIWVGGSRVGKLNPFTISGRPLTPITQNVVPLGHVFVAGTHAHSFDSRYKEFGLVAEKNIVGRVVKLW